MRVVEIVWIVVLGSHGLSYGMFKHSARATISPTMHKYFPKVGVAAYSKAVTSAEQTPQQKFMKALGSDLSQFTKSDAQALYALLPVDSPLRSLSKIDLLEDMKEAFKKQNYSDKDFSIFYEGLIQEQFRESTFTKPDFTSYRPLVFFGIATQDLHKELSLIAMMVEQIRRFATAKVPKLTEDLSKKVAPLGMKAAGVTVLTGQMAAIIPFYVIELLWNLIEKRKKLALQNINHIKLAAAYYRSQYKQDVVLLQRIAEMEDHGIQAEKKTIVWIEHLYNVIASLAFLGVSYQYVVPESVKHQISEYCEQRVAELRSSLEKMDVVHKALLSDY